MATTTNLGKVVITPRGSYSPSTAYVALDIIEYNGSGYLVLAPVTGVTPPNATYYMLLVSKGTKGDTGQASTVEVGTVTSLPAGATPTVVNSGTENAAIFDFGLTQGNNWYTGDAITGTSTTPTAYATGITLAGVGDLYLNPSLTADQGNIYQCTTGGNAATARWIYVGNITGTLAGAVAYTAQTPTTGQKTQARANIAAVGYEAQTLDAGQKAQTLANIGGVGVGSDGKVANTYTTLVYQTKSEDYTLVAGDEHKITEFTATANCTIPASTFDVGVIIPVCNSSGTLTIVAGSGVTLVKVGGFASAAANAAISLVHLTGTGTETWLVVGATAE